MRVLSGIQIGALVLALGCSGEAVAPPARLVGTWDFVFSGSNIDGVRCTSSMVFTITQNDQTFVGEQQGAGTASCSGVAAALISSSTSTSTAINNESIRSGLVGESDVAFNTALLLTTNTGTVFADGQMSGLTTWQVPVKPNGTVTVHGPWVATRR